MKKYYYFTFLIVLVFSMLSCNPKIEHIHSFSKEWTSNETYHWHSATCEHTDEVSDKAEHAFDEWFSNNDATTEHDGTKSRICSVCAYKETVTDEGTKIHVHDLDIGTVTKEATCTEEGEKTFRCTECDEIIKTESIEKKEHSFGEWISNNDATTEHDGTKSRKCSVCEFKETVTDEGSKIHKHVSDNGIFTKQATCIEDGIKTFTCKDCHEVIKTESVPKTCHSFGNWFSNNDATTEKDGTKSRICSVCEYKETVTDEGSIIHDHISDNGSITKHSTCQEEGKKTYTCIICHKTIKTESIQKSGHSFGVWVSNNDATTEHDGTKSHYCSVCNYEETVPDEGSKLHSHVSDNGTVTKQPTCYEEGFKTYTCTECHQVINTESIPKTDHIFGDYTYNNDATYDQDGTKTHVCSVCEYEETVPAKGPYTATYQFTDSVVIMSEDTSGSCGTSATYVLFGDFPQTAAASGIEFNLRPDDNGYYAGSDGNYYANYYDEYFIVEPIKWRVLDNEFDYDGPENTDTAKLLFAENAIMSGIAFWVESYNGNPILNEIQFNNYKYSTIRAYLNGSYEADDFQQFTYENNGFLQTAFTASAQEKILTTYVVNDAASTSDDTGTLSTADEYICGPTFDKIFLLSKKEVTTTAYGFDAYDNTEPGNSRIKIPTDYVKARGIVTGTSYNEEGAVWWLRSPCYKNNYNKGEYIQFINKNGLANLNQNFTYNVASVGIIPALAVKF